MVVKLDITSHYMEKTPPRLFRKSQMVPRTRVEYSELVIVDNPENRETLRSRGVVFLDEYDAREWWEE